jgi:NADH-quinone oxidoreductase subunit G
MSEAPASDAVAEEATVSVTIDGVAVAARPGELVIEAAERAGVFVPRFCYHPRMKPVGMCRMCLVEISGPRGFSLQPACYLRVVEGMEVRTASPKARKAQEGVLEFLLLNHPLDCPVCDKGGECPLQDQTLVHGPGDSRFVEEKRHWAKPIEIGPLVALDRERCIQCARCTRFAAEIAGEPLIDFAARGDQIEVATFPSRPFSSYFSGNTVQICPVGALTATPYRFKSRPWDLEQVETTCTTCAVGCRVVAQSSAGRLVRYLGVDSDPINQSWLCDKGRFAYEASDATNRVRHPSLRIGGEQIRVQWPEALARVAAAIRQARDEPGPASVAVLGGARLTNEDAYAWSKLARTVLQTDSVDAQLDDGLPAEVVLGLPRATIDDAVHARLVVLIGPDLREELPVLYLRLRVAAEHEGLTLLSCSSIPQALDAQAAVRVGYLPGEVARLAEALVATGEPAVPVGTAEADLAAARQLLFEAVSAGHERGEGVVFVVGRPNLAEAGDAYADAALVLARALPGARFLTALRRSNIHGALEMGLAPGILPGRVGLEAGRAWFEAAWGAVPERPGLGARGILEAAAAGEVGVLFLLGADPIADFPDRALAQRALSGARTVVALASHLDASCQRAEVVLPLAGADERPGTTTNLEGRVTRVAPKVVPPGTAWPAWMIAEALASELGTSLGCDNLGTISKEIAQVAPSQRGIDLEVLGRPEHRDGIVAPLEAVAVRVRPLRPIDPIATPGILSVEEQGSPEEVGEAVPGGGLPRDTATPKGEALRRPALLEAPSPRPVEAAPRLDAYSLRLVVDRTLYDRGTLVAASPSLARLAPEPVVRLHPSVLERLGVSDGEVLRVLGPAGALELPARADGALAREVAVVTASLSAGEQPGATVLLRGGLVTDVRLETI